MVGSITCAFKAISWLELRSKKSWEKMSSQDDGKDPSSRKASPAKSTDSRWSLTAELLEAAMQESHVQQSQSVCQDGHDCNAPPPPQSSPQLPQHENPDGSHDHDPPRKSPRQLSEHHSQSQSEHCGLTQDLAELCLTQESQEGAPPTPKTPVRTRALDSKDPSYVTPENAVKRKRSSAANTPENPTPPSAPRKTKKPRRTLQETPSA